VPLCVLPVFTSLPAPASVLSATWETNAGALLSLLHGLPPWKVLSPAAQLEHAFARTWAESAGSSGALQVLTSRDELELYVVQRSLCPASTSQGQGCRYSAAILGIEGVDALAGMGGGNAAAAADEVFLRGVRCVALHHAADNAAGRSRHTASGAGGESLTAWGAALVARLDTLGVVLDLSHSHDEAITSLLAANLTRRMALTHVVPAAVAASCAASGGAMGRRPGSWGPPVAVVDEALLSAVAAGGGVIGVSFAACVGPDGAAVGPWAADPVGGVAASVASLVALLGAHHVALGSDWDGGVVLPTALDAAGMPALREALLAAGLTPEQEGLVTGGTALQLLRDTLPSDLEMAETAARGVASRRVSVLNDDGTTYDVWL
jgi:membrane dipeptidase